MPAFRWAPAGALCGVLACTVTAGDAPGFTFHDLGPAAASSGQGAHGSLSLEFGSAE
jgi:hypothetical protein